MCLKNKFLKEIRSSNSIRVKWDKNITFFNIARGGYIRRFTERLINLKENHQNFFLEKEV